MKKQKHIFLCVIAIALFVTACKNNAEQTPSHKDRDYQVYYDACPDAVYPAQEWFSADGRLDFRFP